MLWLSHLRLQHFPQFILESVDPDLLWVRLWTQDSEKTFIVNADRDTTALRNAVWKTTSSTNGHRQIATSGEMDEAFLTLQNIKCRYSCNDHSTLAHAVGEASVTSVFVTYVMCRRRKNKRSQAKISWKDTKDIIARGTTVWCAGTPSSVTGRVAIKTRSLTSISPIVRRVLRVQSPVRPNTWHRGREGKGRGDDEQNNEGSSELFLSWLQSRLRYSFHERDSSVIYHVSPHIFCIRVNLVLTNEVPNPSSRFAFRFSSELSS